MYVIQKLARPRYILMFLAGFLGCHGLMLPITSSLRAEHISTTFDLMFGFSYGQARDHLALYSDAAKTYYGYLQLVDIVVPIVYGLFLFSLIAFLLEKLSRGGPRIFLLSLVPLAGAACDLLENVGIFSMFRIYPGSFRVVAHITSVANIMKWTSSGAAILTAVVLGILLVAARSRKNEGYIA